MIERVTVTNRHRAVLERLAIDRDAEGRAYFILAAITAPDRAFLVIKRRHVRLERFINLAGDFGHAVFFHQGEDGRLDRSQPRMELQEYPLGRLAVLVGCFVLVVSLAEKCQRRPIRARRRLNHVRHETFLGQIIEVAQIASAALVTRLAFGVRFNHQVVALVNQLAFHVAA